MDIEITLMEKVKRRYGNKKGKEKENLSPTGGRGLSRTLDGTVECGVWSVECEAWSVECGGVWSVEVECGCSI